MPRPSPLRAAARMTVLGAALLILPRAGKAQAPRTAADSIRARSVAFSQHYVRNEIEDMMVIYAPDASIFPPGQPILRGTDALRKYWTHGPDLQVVEHKATPDSIVVVGGTAYDYGTYTVTTKTGDTATRTTNGKYVIVWNRAADGMWRIFLDIWNASPAR